MKDFSHVPDEGVRKYLEEGSDDFSVVAAQLDAAFRHLSCGYVDRHIPLDVIEDREAAYDEACEHFGWRDLEGTHKALKSFWEV